jgi:hypothetical protein
MAQENVEIVERVLAEFIATDQLSDEVAADLIWDVSTFRGWPEQPIFRGFGGFEEFLSAWRAPYEDWSLEVEQILEAGDDRVVAILMQRGRLRGTDTDVSLRYGLVYTLANDQVQGAQVYMTPEETLAAVGLAE